jgi:hypothetical protein
MNLFTLVKIAAEIQSAGDAVSVHDMPTEQNVVHPDPAKDDDMSRNNLSDMLSAKHVYMKGLRDEPQVKDTGTERESALEAWKVGAVIRSNNPFYSMAKQALFGIKKVEDAIEGGLRKAPGAAGDWLGDTYKREGIFGDLSATTGGAVGGGGGISGAFKGLKGNQGNMSLSAPFTGLQNRLMIPKRMFDETLGQGGEARGILGGQRRFMSRGTKKGLGL